MALYEQISIDRISELCTQFIEKSIKEEKALALDDVRMLSTSEIAMLYINTAEYAEKSITAEINKSIYYEEIINRLKSKPVYVIQNNGDLYLHKQDRLLIYDSEQLAKNAAEYLNEKNKTDKFSFNVLKMSNSKTAENMLDNGIICFLINGAKLAMDIEDMKE